MIYPMMSMHISRSCLDGIEILQRSFIWGDTKNVRRAHVIGWNTMTMPKQLGGHGTHNLRIMNDACLMKLGWNLHQGKDRLWTQVLWGKYGQNSDATAELVVKHTDSDLWKGIVMVWPNLMEHEYWAVGNGTSIKFWTDKWIDDRTRILVLENVTIISVVPPHNDNDMDVKLWPGNSMGGFTDTEAYRRMAGFHMHHDLQSWKQIWRIEAAERPVLHFMTVEDHLMFPPPPKPPDHSFQLTQGELQVTRATAVLPPPPEPPDVDHIVVVLQGFATLMFPNLRSLYRNGYRLVLARTLNLRNPSRLPKGDFYFTMHKKLAVEPIVILLHVKKLVAPTPINSLFALKDVNFKYHATTDPASLSVYAGIVIQYLLEFTEDCSLVSYPNQMAFARFLR
ncbi:hypothetical protein TSUD_193810 [Trifolium subterraneum]|uniref:Reverse transcriptase zinc-binding domain-containing protein n=1 Tax=Trifolium subterraneum TaxID=3900 RepID=A0A2Z6LMT6_TRISU|nr:hypothetical protein TSUD_193810 [Trifolium subterraneum]